MKNILIIATYFPPMGGVGTVRVTKYVKYLKKFNWNPIVITIGEKFIKNYDSTLLKDIEGIEVIKLDLNIDKYKKLEKAFYKSLKKQISSILEGKKYDAFFITGGPFEPMKIAPYIYKKYKIPYIIDLRDPWKLQRINNSTKLIKFKSKLKKFLIGFVEKKILKKAFSICTVNDTMTEEYKKEYPILKEKFITIPNGYDPIDYDKIKPKKIEGFNIVYAGKFSVSAGFRDPTPIFKAIKKVNLDGKNVKFIHIGQEEEKIIKLAEQEEVSQYCTFEGIKSYKESLEYCKSADILLVIGGSEKSEQTGKIFDYIGCKRPILVLANKNSEINVVCQDIDNAYCVSKEETNNIANTIIQIYEQKDKREYQDIEKYTREKLTYKLVKILNKIKEEQNAKK